MFYLQNQAHLLSLKFKTYLLLFSTVKDYGIHSKTICLFDLGITQFERIACQTNNKISIVNAGIYNSSHFYNNTSNKCSPINQTNQLIKKVTQLIQYQCTSYSCLIQRNTIKSFLDRSYHIYLDHLILDINYSCYYSMSKYFLLLISSKAENEFNFGVVRKIIFELKKLRKIFC